MMTFQEAFLCGSGLLLGMGLGLCVTGVTWIFLKETAYRLLGIQKILDENRQYNQYVLESLRERNIIAHDAIGYLESIALAIEMFEDDDDGEAWKLPSDNQG
jgi:hypothetical protein